MKTIRTVFSWILLAMALACVVSAQTEDQDQQEIPTFKSDVKVVNLFFHVKDKKGTFVPNLTRQDFQVFEDGTPQTIKYFNANTELPLTVGVLMDTSGSQKSVLAMEQEIGGAFLAEVLQQRDSAFVITVDLDAELVQDMTSSPLELRNALNNVKINEPMCAGTPGMGIPEPSSCRGGTVLYDAIFLASDEKLKNEKGRKVLVILSDGQDEGSKLRLKDAIDAAQKADAVVYVLLIADHEFYGRYGYAGDMAMKQICQETGGRMISVGNNHGVLREAFDQIAAEMRSQYSIGYTPTNRALDGTFRKIEIRVKSPFKVQARDGYYAKTPTE